MRLVFITQRVDPDDPVLGATVGKLRALARQVDELVVLALHAKPAALPGNVRIRLFDAPNAALKGARLLAALTPELRTRPVAVLAHMAPIYAVIAASVTRPLRVPLLLWFTHYRQSRTLALAERLSTRVLTVSSGSFPLPSDKVVWTGHGIELPEDPPSPRVPDGTLRLLALGRTSPAKGLDGLLNAVALLPDLPIALVIRGPSMTEEERDYRAALSGRIATEGLEERVQLAGPVPQSDVGGVYATNDVLVNNTRAGALDKVVYEAAAARLAVAVANPTFASLVDGFEVPLRFSHDVAAEIAARVRGLYELGPDGRARIGHELRERVSRDHSVDHWADAVLAAAR